jgi:hypothetical protein
MSHLIERAAMRLVLTPLLMLVTATVAAADHFALHTTAAAMAVGPDGVTALIPANTASQTAAWTSTGATGSHLGFCDALTWDPLRDRFHFFGGDHGGSGAHVELVQSTNTWTNVGNPSPPLGAGSPHCYDRTAMDGFTGNIYVRGNANHTQIFRSTNGGSSFSLQYTLTLGFCQASALGFFPTMGARGSLIAVHGCGKSIVRVDLSTGAHTTIGSGLTMGGLHTFYEYNPVCDCAIAGGGEGSSGFVKITRDARGTPVVTQMAAAPMGLGVQEVTTVADPVSAHFIILCGRGCSGGTGLWQFNATTNTWAQLIATTPALLRDTGHGNEAHARACTPAPYGVILCVLMDAGRPASHRTILYKHTTTPTVR